jgi:DNA replication protein DnaC
VTRRWGPSLLHREGQQYLTRDTGTPVCSTAAEYFDLTGILRDAMMTAAAIDRLVHHCVIIELNIPSYRIEEAKKNRQAEGE